MSKRCAKGNCADAQKKCEQIEKSQAETKAATKSRPRKKTKDKVTLPMLMQRVKGFSVLERDGERIKLANQTTTTRILVHFDAGFGNQLYIRGQGGELSWDQGLIMQNVAGNLWVWETSTTDDLEFKILINDTVWEYGENHFIDGCQSGDYWPKF